MIALLPAYVWVCSVRAYSCRMGASEGKGASTHVHADAVVGVYARAQYCAHALVRQGGQWGVQG